MARHPLPGSSSCSPEPGRWWPRGQFADGHAALLESITLAPAEAVALRVQLTTACAGVEHLLGRHEQAHARLTGAMDGLRDPASPEAAALMIELAMDGFFRMDYELMSQWAERALSTARPLGDRPLTAAAVAALAFACATAGPRQSPRHVSPRRPRSWPISKITSSPFGWMPPPTWPAQSSTSTATRRRKRTPNER